MEYAAFAIVGLAFVIFALVVVVVVIAWLIRLAKPKPATPVRSVAAEPLRPFAPSPAPAATPEVTLLNLARDYKRIRKDEEELAETRRVLDGVVFFAGKLAPPTESAAPSVAPGATAPNP